MTASKCPAASFATRAPKSSTNQNRRSFVLYINDKCCFTMATLIVALVTTHVFALVMVYNIFMYHLEMQSSTSSRRLENTRLVADTLKMVPIENDTLEDETRLGEYSLRHMLQLDTLAINHSRNVNISLSSNSDISGTKSGQNLSQVSPLKPVQIVEVNVSPIKADHEWSPEEDWRENEFIVQKVTPKPVVATKKVTQTTTTKPTTTVTTVSTTKTSQKSVATKKKVTQPAVRPTTKSTPTSTVQPKTNKTMKVVPLVVKPLQKTNPVEKTKPQNKLDVKKDTKLPSGIKSRNFDTLKPAAKGLSQNQTLQKVAKTNQKATEKRIPKLNLSKPFVKNKL